jgi:hypothetical protein
MSEFYKNLEAKIQATYESGVTIDVAEALAAEFLHAQIRVSEELKKADLNARMHKSGLKAVKAAVYFDIVKQNDKKPTESALEHAINTSPMVNGEQEELDVAESERDNLERYYNIFRDAHIFFRGISKGNFSG